MWQIRMLALVVILQACSFAAALPEPQIIWTCKIEGEIVGSPEWYDNGDGTLDVLVTSTAGKLARIDPRGKIWWEHNAHSAIHASAASGNLDGEGEAEIVSATTDGLVFAVDPLGRILWQYPMEGSISERRSPVVADLDADGKAEVIATDDAGWIVALSGGGERLWRFTIDPYRASLPAVGDLDGDALPEIVYGTENGRIVALDGRGRMTWIRRLPGDTAAKFGRAGPVLADINGDNYPDVITNDTFNTTDARVYVLDGITGEPVWSAPTRMWGYANIAVADLDGYGANDIFYGDRSNTIYCFNVDGSERWRTTRDGGAIYHAPVIADLDGDGALEIVYSIRYGGWGILSDEGGVLYEDTSVEANASALAGDLDGDGQIELVVPMTSQGELIAYRFGEAQGGRVAWPSHRANAARTALFASDRQPPRVATANTVAQSLPIRLQAPEAIIWGMNEITVRWPRDLPERALAELIVEPERGARETRVHTILNNERPKTLPVILKHEGNNTVRAVLWDELSGDPIGRAEIEVALSRGERVNAARSEIELDAVTRERMKAAQKEADQESIDRHLTSNSLLLQFLDWEDPNPWDEERFLQSLPQQRKRTPIRADVYKGEWESRAVNLFNRSHEVRAYRVHVSEELRSAVELRESIMVPRRDGKLVPDALPRLNEAQTIMLPPGEARQLWINFHSGDLKPGVTKGRIVLMPIGFTGDGGAVDVELNVIDLDLAEAPEFRQCNWINPSQFRAQGFSDEQFREAIQFGLNVITLSSPAYRSDERGELSLPVDFEMFDRDLDALTPNTYLLIHFSYSSKAEDRSVEYERGYAAALRHFAEHLKEKGWPLDHWAVYPVDEPGLFQGRNTAAFVKAASLTKRVAPEIQVYANPAGGVTKENFAEAFQYGDVWAPELGMLLRDPSLVDFFKAKGDTVWSYEAPGMSKYLRPLGFYRSQSLIAFSLGLTGAGFWIFFDRNDDMWSPESTGWGANYASDGVLVYSRRWHAVRDGIEDARALMMLKTEMEKAEAAGTHVETTRAARELLEIRFPAAIAKPKSADDITRHLFDYDPDLNELREIRAEATDLTLKLRAPESPLETVLRNTKPLPRPRGERLPMYVWSLTNVPFENDAEGERILRELDARGLALIADPGTGDLSDAAHDYAIRLGKLQQKLGLHVNVNANALMHSFFDGSAATAHIDDKGEPFFDSSFGNPKMGCPFALRHRVEPMRERMEANLDLYEKAEIDIDFIFADWEIDGPIEWNGAWDASKRCARCRENISDINDFAAFQKTLRTIRSDLQRRVFAEPVLTRFPKALVGNYGLYPDDGWRYWFDYYETLPEGAPIRREENAVYRPWFDEFPLTGYTCAMPVVYTWYSAFDGYPSREPDDRWFHNLSLTADSAAKAAGEKIPLIPFIHWHTTAPPDNPDPNVKQFSEARYQALLRRMLELGHDTFFIWCLPHELAKEVRLAHEVYSQSFN